MSEKGTLRLIYVVSALVFGLVAYLNSLPPQEVIPDWIYKIPKMNAAINSVCTLFLVMSYIMIRRKQVRWHKVLNLSTFFLSSIFLVLYIIYHSRGIEVSFPTDNPLRPVYLFILLTHIVLAAGVFPLILISFFRSLTGNIEKHRRIGRITMPIWLYVTLTGVIVYYMISPYYPWNV